MLLSCNDGTKGFGSMISGNIAVSGVHFQAKRLAASAHNVANATTGPISDEQGGRQARLRVEGVSQAEGGVRGEPRPEPRRELPEADRRPDAFDQAKEVRLEEEIARQQEIKQAHAANLKVVRAEERMLGTLLDREV